MWNADLTPREVRNSKINSSRAGLLFLASFFAPAMMMMMMACVMPKHVLKSCIVGLFDIGNWTEWSVVWNHTRVSKIEQVISDHSCTTRSSEYSGWFVETAEPETLWHSFRRQKRKRCDLEKVIVQFVNKLYCWEPIWLQGSPVISKWM